MVFEKVKKAVKDYGLIASLLILIILGAIIFNLRAQSSLEKERKIVFEVYCPDILPEVSEQVRVGDKVFTDPGGMLIGKVAKVRAEPSKRPVTTDDGKVVVGINPLSYDLYITVEGRGRVSERLIALKNQVIQANAEFRLTSARYQLKGLVVKIFD